MDTTIAKIKKNATAEVWILLRVYNGRQFVDIREHFFLADDREWHPTKKGVMVAIELLPEVIDGIAALQGVSNLGTIATIGKTDKDEIRVGYREFSGRRYAEVRIWYSAADGHEKKPSNKGVTFKLDHVEPIVEALRQAEDQLDQR